jgi:hypothetical protein
MSHIVKIYGAICVWPVLSDFVYEKAEKKEMVFDQ